MVHGSILWFIWSLTLLGALLDSLGLRLKTGSVSVLNFRPQSKIIHMLEALRTGVAT